MAGTVTVEGFEDLDQRLKSLIEQRGEQILRKALRAGGELMQAAVVERAPMRTDMGGGKQNSQNPAYNLPQGALKSDIGLRVGRDKNDNSLTARIEPGKYSRPVSYWLEYGHKLVSGGRLNYRGGRSKGKVVGFVTPRPFIRPAFDTTEDEARAAIEEVIAAEINKLSAEGRR